MIPSLPGLLLLGLKLYVFGFTSDLGQIHALLWTQLISLDM